MNQATLAALAQRFEQAAPETEEFDILVDEVVQMLRGDPEPHDVTKPHLGAAESEQLVRGLLDAIVEQAGDARAKVIWTHFVLGLDRRLDALSRA